MNKKLDLEKSKQYTLSIRLSADGFSFSIYDPTEKASIIHTAYRIEPNISLTANVKQAWAKNEFLKLPFKRVNLLIDTPRYTTVPLELFEEAQAETIYYHNHPRNLSEVVSYNILNRSNCVILFSIDKSTYNLLYEYFPQARLYATVCPVIEYLCDRSRLGNNRKLYAYIQKKHIDILAFERGKLLFANTFPNRGNADCIYFILNVWKQIGLEQEIDELYLTGTPNDKENFTDELRKYVKIVSFMPPIATYSRTDNQEPDEVPYDIQALLMSNL